MLVSTKRQALKVLGTAALAGVTGIGARRASAVPDLKYQPEKGANLKVLRWKSFVQAAEDQFQLITRNFVERSGINGTLENVAIPDVPAKAAMAANVGGGYDVAFGFYDTPHLYVDNASM